MIGNEEAGRQAPIFLLVLVSGAGEDLDFAR